MDRIVIPEIADGLDRGVPLERITRINATRFCSFCGASAVAPCWDGCPLPEAVDESSGEVADGLGDAASRPRLSPTVEPASGLDGFATSIRIAGDERDGAPASSPFPFHHASEIDNA